MKTNPFRTFAPAIIVLALFIISGYLYSQNITCSQKNKELVLQNDSLASMNLRLANELEKLKKTQHSHTTEPGDTLSFGK